MSEDNRTNDEKVHDWLVSLDYTEHSVHLHGTSKDALAQCIRTLRTERDALRKCAEAQHEALTILDMRMSFRHQMLIGTRDRILISKTLAEFERLKGKP